VRPVNRRVIEVLAWHPPAPGSNLRDRDRPDWREASLCGQADPEAFFPGKGGSVREPGRICRRCPVREQCLLAGLDGGEESGIWGGLTAGELRAERRRVPRRPLAEMTAASDARAVRAEARIDAMRKTPRGLAA
jgi:WhiB family transcriptional regulator, redox-sensing transcriptional regulator